MLMIKKCLDSVGGFRKCKISNAVAEGSLISLSWIHHLRTVDIMECCIHNNIDQKVLFRYLQTLASFRPFSTKLIR